MHVYKYACLYVFMHTCTGVCKCISISLSLSVCSQLAFLIHPQVQASDPGADGDGVIKYHVSDTDNFKVDEEGVLYNIRPLDYERTSGQYRVQISAESQGELKNSVKKR